MINKRFVFGMMILVLLAGMVSACQPAPQAAPQPAEGQPAKSSEEKASITISGAFAIYPMMVRWAEEYQKIHPNVQIDVSAGGAGKGMSDALGGMVEIGMVSREIKKEELDKGAFDIAICKDAVFPTINEKNPAVKEIFETGLKKEFLSGIYFEGKSATWGDAVNKPEIKDAINVYTRSDACGAAEVWAKLIADGKQESLKGIGVSGDPGLLDAVKKDVVGIGYNNLNYAFDAATGKPVAGALVAPIDFNGNGKADENEIIDTKEKAVKAVATGDYPEPPARLLHLVTKGKPTGATLEFLTWILNDGQKYLDEVGYIAQKTDQLAAQIEKLK